MKWTKNNLCHIIGPSRCLLTKAYSTLLQHFINKGNAWEGNIAPNMDVGCDLQVQVVRWGRSIYCNIQKFIQFQTTVNGVALTLNFITAIASGNAPLTAVQVRDSQLTILVTLKNPPNLTTHPQNKKTLTSWRMPYLKPEDLLLCCDMIFYIFHLCLYEIINRMFNIIKYGSKFFFMLISCR